MMQLLLLLCIGAATTAWASLQTDLFPPSFRYSSGFTTASGVTVAGVSQTVLADGPLKVVRVTSGLTHAVVRRAGKNAWEAVYPVGSYKPSAQPRGGFGFYVGGSEAFERRTRGGAGHVLFGYSVMFQDAWEWNMGGKLPGGFGGVGDAAFGCSGGRQDGRDVCFSLRLMWREHGAGELYTYLPLTDRNRATALAVRPFSDTNDTYGYSVGRGSFTFPAGRWATVAQRIKLNDPGAYNGEIQLWFNGASVMNIRGLQIRTSADSLIRGMHFQTFFGGNSTDWASPKDQTAWFADVSGAIIT